MPEPQTTYRVINDDDMQAIFDLRVATWHNENGLTELTQMGITHDSVRAMMRSTHKGWLCERGGEVIGFAMGNRENGEMWVIAVLKEYEGRGIGRALLTRVEDWLFEHGHEQIWLTTDPDEAYRAVTFYRRCGWADWKIENGDRFMTKTKPPDQ